MAYADLSGNPGLQAGIRAIAGRVNSTPEIVADAIDADKNRSGNSFDQVYAWFSDSSHDGQLRDIIAGLPNRGQSSGGGSRNNSDGMPQAPEVVAGGNLVKSVNTRYAQMIMGKQAEYQNANAQVFALADQITAKQSQIADYQRQRDFFQSEAQLWLGRHKNCGPFSRYGCTDADNNVTRNENQQRAMEAAIATGNTELAALQASMENGVGKRLNAIKAELLQMYAQYTTDVTAAIMQERAAQETQSNAAAAAQETRNMADPAYWAAKAEAAKQQALKEQQDATLKTNLAIAQANAENAAKLQASELAAKTQLHKMLLAAAVVVALAVVGLVGWKIINR